MGDSTPPLTAGPPGEPLVYRPLSAPAIVGLACAAVYTLLLVFSLVLVFLQHEPFIPPSWLLVLPIAGLVLGYVALRQIRNSEGTRAGAALARWAVGLSALSGAGALTYSIFTGLAIKQQANQFMMEEAADAGFFPRLIAGDANGAFLLTRLPRERRGVNPKNAASMERFEQADPKNPRGPLTLFRDSDLVRALRTTTAGKPEVEPLGVSSWGYADKGYRVDRTYRLKTPEAVYNLPLTTLSIDSDASGEGRRWMVLWRPADRLPRPELTPFGEKMMRLRLGGYQFVGDFLTKLQAAKGREVSLAFLSTRPPGDRLALAKRLVKGTKPEALDGFKKFEKGEGILQMENVRGVDAKLIGLVRKVLPVQFFGPNPPEQPVRMAQDAALTAPWVKEDGKIRFAYDLDCPLKLPEADPPTFLALLGRVVVETDEAAPGQWRVVRLEFDRAAAMRLPPTGPGPK